MEDYELIIKQLHLTFNEEKFLILTSEIVHQFRIFPFQNTGIPACAQRFSDADRHQRTHTQPLRQYEFKGGYQSAV